MIQGFETRTYTDITMHQFVESVNGVLHKKLAEVPLEAETKWPTFRSVSEYPCAFFGNARGVRKLIAACNQEKQDWFYIDHAYFGGNNNQKSLLVNDKVYRITKNKFQINTIQFLSEQDYKRIQKYKKYINFQDWNYDESKKVLVLAPSIYMETLYNKPNWVENIIKKITPKLRGRKIKVRLKGDPKSIDQDIQDSSCVVSMQSAAVVKAMLFGVPSFCESFSMGAPVSNTDFDLDNVIFPQYREAWLNTLLANQFTSKEILDGTAYNKANNA